MRSATQEETAAVEETLDPADWDAARDLIARAAVDAVDHLRARVSKRRPAVR